MSSSPADVPSISQLFILGPAKERSAIRELLSQHDLGAGIKEIDIEVVAAEKIPSDACCIIVSAAVEPTPGSVRFLQAQATSMQLRRAMVIAVPGLNALTRKLWLRLGGPSVEVVSLSALSPHLLTETIENAKARFYLSLEQLFSRRLEEGIVQLEQAEQLSPIGSLKPFHVEYITAGPITKHPEHVRDVERGITGVHGITHEVPDDGVTLESLRENEERLRLATSLADIAFWDVDLVHDTLLWPPSLKAMFGVSPTQPVSMADFYGGLHPGDRDATVKAFDAACDPQQRELYDVEYRTIGKEDGVLRWVAAKGRAIFDEGGRCIRVLGTAIDISQRKASEQARLDSEALLRVVTDNAKVGVVVVGEDRCYRFANQAYAQILSLPSAEIVGQRVADVLPAVYEEQIAPRLTRAFDGEQIVYELVVPALKGATERLYMVTYQPSRQNDGESVVLVVIYDVTEREHAKRQAEYGRQLLEAFVESVPGVVYAKDVHGRMLIANRGTTELIGKPQAEYIGKTDAEFLENRAQGEAIMANDRRIMLSGQPEQVEEAIRLLNGENAIWLSTKVPLVDQHGRVTGLVGSSIDITARKFAEAKLRDSEAALRLFADAMPNLAWMGDAEGSPFWHNQRWHDYTGLPLWDQSGWRLSRLHDPVALPEVEQLWAESMQTGAPFEMSFPLLGADGITRPFLTRIVPMHDVSGKITRWFGTHTDVSPERAVQEKLSASEALLREADRRKDEFLATLSHELRNPLAPVLTASSLLGSTNLPPEKVVWASQIIRRQVQHMARLLDDLLDVARITRGKLEIKREPIILSDVIDTAVETMRPLLERKRHILKVSLPAQPLSLMADPVRLSQIISNLLSNAAKYTDPGGRIGLDVQVKGDSLELCVSDNGIGLTPAAADQIFTMFAQVREGAHHSDGGLGIGLTLCKGLAELHDGDINVTSGGPGQGSVFIVRLPLSMVSPTVIAAGTVASLKNPSLRVMVVDDNSDAADTLGALLEYEGYEVRIAHGGRAALTLATTFRPDVAVVDIGMPDIDGHAVARALRHEAWSAGLYLIALTGWGQEEDRRKTAEAGFDFHLTKPVNAIELTSLIATRQKKPLTLAGRIATSALYKL